MIHKAGTRRLHLYIIRSLLALSVYKGRYLINTILMDLGVQLHELHIEWWWRCLILVNCASNTLSNDSLKQRRECVGTEQW